MSHFVRISVVMFVLITCVVAVGSAEEDMSLPEPGFRVNKALRVTGVRNQTPPLINVFPAPDSAMRGLAYDGQFLWAANSGDGNS
jgi:hypothetical protein